MLGTHSPDTLTTRCAGYSAGVLLGQLLSRSEGRWISDYGRLRGDVGRGFEAVKIAIEPMVARSTRSKDASRISRSPSSES